MGGARSFGGSPPDGLKRGKNECRSSGIWRLGGSASSAATVMAGQAKASCVVALVGFARSRRACPWPRGCSPADNSAGPSCASNEVTWR